MTGTALSDIDVEYFTATLITLPTFTDEDTGDTLSYYLTNSADDQIISEQTANPSNLHTIYSTSTAGPYTM
jgi:hypothetical protein